MTTSGGGPGGGIPRPPTEIGVGFWSMQSTYMRPRRSALLYREAAAEARRAEELGFDAMWMGEHHLSYDGYCPSLLPAAAMFLTATTRIKVGTGVLVLPFHAAARVAEGCAALQALAPGRLRTAVGIGYRDVEYAAAGLDVGKRAALMDERLDELFSPPLQERFGATELWFGTGAAAGVVRAARHGASLLLTPNVVRRRLPDLRAQWEEAFVPGAEAVPRFGIMREVWVDHDPRRVEWAKARLFEMWRHYSNFWVEDPVQERERREELAEQMTRTSVFGSPSEVVDRLGGLIEAGVDCLAVRVRFDGVSGPAFERCLELLAAEVLPQLRRVA